MRTQCLHCKTWQEVPADYSSKKVKCTNCKQMFLALEYKPGKNPPPVEAAPVRTEETYRFAGLYLRIFGFLILFFGGMYGIHQAIDYKNGMPLLVAFSGGLGLCGLSTLANLLGKLIETIQKGAKNPKKNI